MLKKSSVICATVCVQLIASAALADPAPAPTPAYSAGAAAVVAGLNGLVTGTKSGVDSYRTASRILSIRASLITALLKLETIDDAHPPQIEATNIDVLCAPRGAQASIAATSSYISSITGTLDKFAAPAKITTIGEAFGSIFQNYTIDESTAKVAPKPANSVTKSCDDDSARWVLPYYGSDVQNLGTPAKLIDPVSLIATAAELYQALVSIITPIITTPAAALDAKKRSDEINSFLKKYRKDLLAAAQNLATFGGSTATTTRLQAVGQFAENMATLRATKLQLSKIDACKAAYGGLPASRVYELKDASGKVVAQLPTDAFVSCYAQLWGQVKSTVEAAATAAAQYDTLADTSSDQLQNSVTVIQKNIDKLDQPNKPDFSQLMSAATQLITYGQAVSTALSATNIAKVKTDVQNLMKQLGG